MILQSLYRLALRLCLLSPCAFALHAQQPTVLHADNPPNSAATQAKHYVVLVSLDGFRYDYAQKYGAKHLDAIAKEGASAPDGMLPSYPTVTFPNHYTVVTGLYPEHHGIVANSFYDPIRKQRYSNTDPASVTDGSWYGGTPLWVLAEKQGMRAACFFWPGSEAAIQDLRPSYYLRFDNKVPDDTRISQGVAWLRLPPEQRPHFITLYYGEPDHSGHEFGPDSPQVRDAVHHVDELVGKLKAQLDSLHLPIDLIVLSDHGMERVQGAWIDLDKYADLSGFITDGPLLYANTGSAANDEAAAERVYNQLKKVDSRFMVYRRSRIPAALEFNQNPREGDPIVVPTGPYLLRAQPPATTAAMGPGVASTMMGTTTGQAAAAKVANSPSGTASASRTERPPPAGMHGYDPANMKTMRAIFYAAGPDIRPGATVKPFENVNVYPLIAHILALDPPKVDGSLNVLSGILAEDDVAEKGVNGNP
jgi:alkaline phosphatase D